MADHRSTSSNVALSGVRVRAAGEATYVAVWCAWCECVHYHGAGAGGERGAHCGGHRAGSPLTSYRVAIMGDAATDDAARPAGPFVGARKLVDAIGTPWRGPSLITRTVTRAILGRSVRAGFHRQRLPDRTWLELTSLDYWRIADRQHETIAEGHGLAAMAGHLYGVGEAVASVRILEAATGRALDAEAARDVVAALEGWLARGGRGREP